MKDRKRREEAQERAEDYAPRPVSSMLMYGVVGVCLAGLAWAAFSRFYDLEFFAHPVWMAFVFLLVFVGSIALRLLRSRRHASAHRHEYDKGAPRN
jgi:cytochrome bd-type quinol oxidase subunit 2